MEASKRPTSRRKPAVDEAPKKKMSKRSMLIQGAAVVVVFLLVILATRNGGAPQALSYDTGTAGAEVVAWSHVATYPDGRTETLCARGTECSKAILEAALQEGASCTFSATAWLGSPDNPIWVGGLDVAYQGIFHSGDFTTNETGGLNSTLVQRNGTAAWDGGIWWRGEREELSLRIGDVPCDTWHATLIVEVSGKSWTGKAFASKQRLSVVLHREVVAGGDGTLTTGSG